MITSTVISFHNVKMKTNTSLKYVEDATVSIIEESQLIRMCLSLRKDTEIVEIVNILRHYQF